jgi:hypothetical protein
MKKGIRVAILIACMLISIPCLADFQKANFAESHLSLSIAKTTSSITVTTGQGILFPHDGKFIAVIWKAGYTNASASPSKEIVWLTWVSGDTFTAIRAQEGTKASSWNVGDKIANNVTGRMLGDYQPSNIADARLYNGGVLNDTTILTAQTANSGVAIVLATGTWNINNNLTITNNIIIPQGAVLNVASGKTVTIRGSLNAGLYKIFSGSGTVILASNIREAYPQWWGALGNGTEDDTIAIQSAINSLSSIGGTVFFAPGHYKTTSTITIGNGTSSAWSTLKPVTLRGSGSGGSAGPSLLGPSVFIEAYYAGPSILVQGPINSWGVENICINAHTTSPRAVGLQLVSAQYGHVKNVSILNFYKAGVYETTVGSLSLNYHNVFDSLWITMPNVSGAIGISITGTGTYGSGFEEYLNTYIAISNASSTGISLGFCDNIKFFNTEIVNAANGTAILFNYANDASFTYRTSLPSECIFYGLEVYGNAIANYAPNGYGPPPGRSANKIYGFSRTNGAVVPHLFNLSVIDDTGSQYASIMRAAALNIVNGSQKIPFDTIIQDPDGIADIKTNHRITPTKAGAYVVTAGVGSASNSGASSLLLTIMKNGNIPIAQQTVNNNGFSPSANTTGIIYMNGTTDYLEAFVYQTGGAVAALVGAQQAYLAIAGPFGGY